MTSFIRWFLDTRKHERNRIRSAVYGQPEMVKEIHFKGTRYLHAELENLPHCAPPNKIGPGPIQTLFVQMTRLSK